MTAPLLALGALLALIAVLVTVATNPTVATLPGLPDAGSLTHWGLPLSRVVGEIASVGVVGWLLAAAVLIPSRDGRLGAAARRHARAAALAAAVWLAATLAELVFTASDISARPAGDVLDPSALRSFVSATSQGRALVGVAAGALVIVLIAPTLMSTVAAGWLLALAGVALLPPVFTGHAAGSSQHALAVVALGVHILAAVVWLGGLLALLTMRTVADAPFTAALRRYSRVAAGAAAFTAVGGIASAAIRLGGFGPLFDDRYGLMVLGKVAGLLAAVALGGLTRRRVIATAATADSGSEATAEGGSEATAEAGSTGAADSETEAKAGAGAEASAGSRAKAAAGAAAEGGQLARRQLFRRLALIESCVLAATFGLAAALSRTSTPVNDAAVPKDATEALLGYPMPPAPTPWRLLADWRPDWVFIGLCVLAAGLYIAGVIRLTRRGDRWPVGRTIGFLGGLLLVVVVTSSGLGRYGPVLLSVHMAQHMILTMLAPIPLVLGAPITLALRALRTAPAPYRSGPREWLVAALHSWPARILTHPLFVTANFAGSLYVIYLSSLLSDLMNNHLGHLFMNAHFLMTGFYFFEVLIGVDPLPKRPPHPGRVLMLVAVIPFHAFLGLTMMSTTTVLGSGWYDVLVRPWGDSPLDDQGTAGGIAWSFGEVPTLIVMLVLAVQWARTDERRARNRERRVDTTGVDEQLDAYNAYLARLNGVKSAPAATATATTAPPQQRQGDTPTSTEGQSS
ncbi:putative copper resistance protein D [Parafrankia irregularis]|uniref:Putative copper resistance protein D n=1 Tax=Parafrankia irregularis TaxID=795642 RepID=A0A0S4QFL7_9ACTN|nr:MULTISPECIES: cytochrome c oxidase assembly protein [Parafrankia]MBE3199815.1 bifunctional copper resistance protein CopD/cytochrome c oxidase assembly protein [Parafrankia sp. CH37]CUU53512.1 putative copper resistance protein D [Parafrankia irregularis]